MRILRAVILIALAALAVPAEDRFFDSAGTRIRYIVEGKGDPVILIHGYGVNIEMMWVETGVVGGLAGRYQVIAMDIRGHGKSGRPHEPRQYGLRMVEDVIRLMDHLAIPKANVVGYSMGGRIATALLADYPSRLSKVVVGGAGLMDAKGLEDHRKLFAELAGSLEQGKGIGPLLTALRPTGAPPPTAEQIEPVNKLFLSLNDPLAMAAVARSSLELQPPQAKLRGNRVPALGLVGDRDPVKAEAENLARVMPHFHLVVVPGATHQDVVRKPEFLGRVKDFLAGPPQ